MSDEHDDVDYDDEVDEEAAAAAPAPAPASASAVKAKGRGHHQRQDESHRGGHYESVDDGAGAGPARSVEGWVVMVTGVHEEAQEDEVVDRFGEYGDVKNVQMNLDRRTGFVKVGGWV